MCVSSKEGSKGHDVRRKVATRASGCFACVLSVRRSNIPRRTAVQKPKTKPPAPTPPSPLVLSSPPDSSTLRGPRRRDPNPAQPPIRLQLRPPAYERSVRLAFPRTGFSRDAAFGVPRTLRFASETRDGSAILEMLRTRAKAERPKGNGLRSDAGTRGPHQGLLPIASGLALLCFAAETWDHVIVQQTAQ